VKHGAWSKSPDELIETFGRAVERLPGVVSRKMFGYPAAFLNGNLFTGLFADRWFVRLSEEDGRQLSAAGGTTFEPMPGRPMRGYLELPRDILADEARRDDWLVRSMRFAEGLPPKPAQSQPRRRK
jgi:TfoX/Sxy family transcriptional regulator of competence genes